MLALALDVGAKEVALRDQEAAYQQKLGGVDCGSFWHLRLGGQLSKVRNGLICDQLTLLECLRNFVFNSSACSSSGRL